MTNKEIYRILKASTICGERVFKSKTLAGSAFTSIIYNKAGDSRPFNPIYSLGDAMHLLSIIGGTLIIKNESRECFVYLEKDYPLKSLDIAVRGSWASKPKNKEKNICNAILNCIITRG